MTNGVQRRRDSKSTQTLAKYSSKNIEGYHAAIERALLVSHYLIVTKENLIYRSFYIRVLISIFN